MATLQAAILLYPVTEHYFSCAACVFSQLPSFGEQVAGRSLDLVFRSRSDLRDASNLIIHYLSYLPSGQTDESFRISQFLHDTLPQFIDMPTTASESTGRQQHGVRIGRYVSGCDSVVTTFMIIIVMMSISTVKQVLGLVLEDMSVDVSLVTTFLVIIIIMMWISTVKQVLPL